MAVSSDITFVARSRQVILEQMQSEFQTLIPDVYLGPDGNLELLLEVFAGVTESVFLAAQLVEDDMFISTASLGAMQRWGEQYGVFQKSGVRAAGTLMFSGEGGIFIPTGSQAAYDPQTGEDVLYFTTVEDGTIPDPGDPTAPTTAAGSAGALTGTYEYGVTFTTLLGETALGDTSTPLAVTSKQINLTNIPIGGPGTVTRKIYRQVAGGGFKYLTEIANNTATTYTDNNSAALTGDAPVVSDAQSIEISAEAEEPGTAYNLVIGMITSVAEAPDGVTTVTNTTAFIGGTSEESISSFRRRLADAVRNPNTGSADDIKQWAEQVEGVETATVAENYNLTSPSAGTVTVWITGPGGALADVSLINLVQYTLENKMRANIQIIVATYTGDVTNVTVTISVAPNYTLSQVSSDVELAISDYLYGLAVGETVRRNGIIDAVFGTTGVLDLVVNTPATDLVTLSGHKRIPGTITVN